jgi:hypothetical protein
MTMTRLLEATPDTIKAIQKAARLEERGDFSTGSVEEPTTLKPKQQAQARTTLTPAGRRNKIYVQDGKHMQSQADLFTLPRDTYKQLTSAAFIGAFDYDVHVNRRESLRSSFNRTKQHPDLCGYFWLHEL